MIGRRNMLSRPDRRVIFTHGDPLPDRPGLETVLIGHCAGAAAPSALPREAKSALRSLGFGDALESPGDGRLERLHHLPLLMDSMETFAAVFPRNTLEPDGPWLTPCLMDFFQAGGEKTWVVRTPEKDGAVGFLPDDPFPDLSRPETLRGVEIALLLDRVGVAAAPDLDRLILPESSKGPFHEPLEKPPPGFTPCGYDYLNVREKDPKSPAAATGRVSFEEGIPPLLKLLHHNRPDIQLLCTLPAGPGRDHPTPRPDADVSKPLERMRSQPETWPHTRQMQLIWPYLRNRGIARYPASGLIAGTIARSARENGAWASIAGKTLVTEAIPFPNVTPARAATLRDHGVGVVHRRVGRVVLDDERMIGGDPRAAFDFRSSAEIVRFVGQIRRDLNALGEHLIFHAGEGDRRMEILLDRYFNGLYEAGALSGEAAEDAFTIAPGAGDGGRWADIMIQPAYPVDEIHIRLIQDQRGRRTEVIDDR